MNINENKEFKAQNMKVSANATSRISEARKAMTRRLAVILVCLAAAVAGIYGLKEIGAISEWFKVLLAAVAVTISAFKAGEAFGRMKR